MTKPESPEHGVTFDINAIAQDLQNEEAYQREGRTARTLVHTADLRVVLIVLKSGNRMSEHHVNVTATVQIVSGHVRLQLPDRSIELPAGQILSLGRGLRHDVEAETNSILLLTLGWHENT
jgi:quercetin dioxygenase-like cupin family protein